MCGERAGGRISRSVERPWLVAVSTSVLVQIDEHAVSRRSIEPQVAYEPRLAEVVGAVTARASGAPLHPSLTVED